MNAVLTGNVLRHLGWQILAAVATAAVASLVKVDYSSLGPYAAAAQAVAALLGSIVNEAMGTAPK